MTADPRDDGRAPPGATARDEVRARATVVADRAARVYRVMTGRGQLGSLYDYHGCTPGKAKPQLLARSVSSLPGVRVYGCGGRGCRLIRAIRLKGATVGAIVEYHGLDNVESTLTVRDLFGDRVLHRVDAATVVGYGTSLITYVLAPSGDIAWSIVTTSAGRRGAFLHVGTIHRVIGQTVTTLDAGPYVRVSSLRLHGATVEWTDRGNQRSAPLP